MSDVPRRILAANDAFYRAFAAGDADAVVALLAGGDQVSVVHPGWPPLRGRAEVEASWRGVLTDPPPIHHDDDVVHLLADDVAVVTCLEVIEDQVLAATNTWVLRDGAWRLAHHQAGPSPRLRPVYSQRVEPGDAFH